MNTVVLDVCHDFLAVAVIFGRFCLKSAQWSFCDANLALKLMAAFNAMRLTLRLLYNLSWLFIHIFLQFDNFFLIFMAFWSYMNTLGVARLCFILHLLHSLPLTVSCFSKIQIGFTFLVPAHPGSPGKRAVKRVFFTDLHSQCSQIVTLQGINIYEQWTLWFTSWFFEEATVILHIFTTIFWQH